MQQEAHRPAEAEALLSENDVRCKGVHVKLDKQTHANFKTKLIQHELSMQDAFEEFARLVGSDNVSATRMLERLVRERVKQELVEAGVTPSKRSRRVNELDHETLYDLINEEQSDEGTEHLQPGKRIQAA